jgi:hypothetical protein
MENFDIDIGSRELYSLKNFSFDIINNGSADLQIDSITVSSTNVELPYINTPFIIMQNTTYTIFGYIKILNAAISNRVDYIDFNVSWLNEHTIRIYDVYRYYLNYEGILYPAFYNIININSITFIKNMLIIYIDNDSTIDPHLNLILKSIDEFDYFIFPKKYKISDRKYCYMFNDNNITNKIIDNNIKFISTYNNKSIDINKISYRIL